MTRERYRSLLSLQCATQHHLLFLIHRIIIMRVGIFTLKFVFDIEEFDMATMVIDKLTLKEYPIIIPKNMRIICKCRIPKP